LWLAVLLGAFALGSLPFSVWLGRAFLGIDVRQFGDGNPGATNVLGSGSKLLALLVLVLDISKAAAPIGLAYFDFGMRGVHMLLVALAPLLGHAFSPFLGFRGGKGLATALGMWIGLTIWKASLVGVIGVVVGIALFAASGWAALVALAGILVALLLWLPDPFLLLVLAGQVLVLSYTHRADLRARPHLRPWLACRLPRARR
jgi:acyl phosphate:glycerol-3-phosphate acyltransferase